MAYSLVIDTVAVFLLERRPSRRELTTRSTVYWLESMRERVAVAVGLLAACLLQNLRRDCVQQVAVDGTSLFGYSMYKQKRARCVHVKLQPFVFFLYLRYLAYLPLTIKTTSILRTTTSVSPSSSVRYLFIYLLVKCSLLTTVDSVRMAQPSSSHREHGERERHHHRSSHHHHRTISSTTLLLVLSLVLAVLAVMLSLPSNQSITSGNSDPNTQGIWNYLTPKRTQALIAREKDVAQREAEVARREAELLAGAPGGVIPPPLVCPPCAASTTIETVTGPIQTIIKEVVKEDSLAPAGWSSPRVDEILDRELKVAERERDISKREESVNRREHDAARRESWIMEQLMYVFR